MVALRSGLVAAALVAATLTGCGSDSSTADEESAAESWAGDVCSSASTFQSAMADLTATLSDTQNLSVNSLKDALSSAATSTTTFVDDLQSLGAPDTEAGTAAKEDLSALAETLGTQRDIIQDAIESPGSGTEDLVATVTAVGGALQVMATAISTTLTNLESLAGGDELKKAFESSEECQQLSSSSSP